ncbi:hypothetical protein GCM10020219_100560 [Nonomuraea dietziae]
MQMLYGYDVAAELRPGTRYDQVVTALGGGGELVTKPSEIGPALKRAFDSGVPYMVNIATDPQVAYPRQHHRGVAGEGCPYGLAVIVGEGEVLGVGLVEGDGLGDLPGGQMSLTTATVTVLPFASGLPGAGT